MRMRSLAFFAVSGIFLGLMSGCGSFNNQLASKTKNVEYYRIYDIKTSAGRRDVAKAASDGIGRNVNEVDESTPIPNFSEPPEKPGRFQISDALRESNLSQLIALSSSSSGFNFRSASCPGAVWTAKAHRKIENSNNLRIHLCLFQYKGGYHLNQYAVFTKKTGGFMQLSRALADSISGTPEEWTERTLLDVVRSINKQITGAEITLLESEPEVIGTPFLSDFDR